MEYAGLVIYYKKIESGRIKLPAFDENTSSITISWQDLITMVENVKTGCGKLHKNVNKNLLFK